MFATAQKEEFSIAYIYALATIAELTIIGAPKVDDDSVDLVLQASGPVGNYHSPQMQLQLKCTKNDPGNPDHLAFPLKRKNYDDLRIPNVMTPRFLVVLVVPEDPSDWIIDEPTHMSLRHVAYWRSLRNEPEHDQDHITVHLPRSNRFCTAGSVALMQRIGTGEFSQ